MPPASDTLKSAFVPSQADEAVGAPIGFRQPSLPATLLIASKTDSAAATHNGISRLCRSIGDREAALRMILAIWHSGTALKRRTR